MKVRRNILLSVSASLIAALCLDPRAEAQQPPAKPALAASKGAAAWRTSWDDFIKAYQACLADSGCDPMSLHGQEVRWQGTFKSIEKKEGKTRISINMTDAKLIDRGNKTIDVALPLSFETADPDSWADLKPGDAVRFTATLMRSPIFVTLKPDCCAIFIVENVTRRK